MSPGLHDQPREAKSIAPCYPLFPGNNESITVVDKRLAWRNVDCQNLVTIAVETQSDVSQRKEIEPGLILNNQYELVCHLGSGGMSSVYLALDLSKQEQDHANPYLAIKLIDLTYCRIPNAATALQKEAAFCQRLSHPNIVQVYGYYRDDNIAYMAMEYVSGVSLATILGQPHFRGLTRPMAHPIVQAIASALGYCHQQGVVHSDLTPSNILVSNTGQVKIIDFGVARDWLPTQASTKPEPFHRKQTLVAYTPAYASPEMIHGESPDPRDDIYAFGCIVYKLLTGTHPFGGKDALTSQLEGMKIRTHCKLSRNEFGILRKALTFRRQNRIPHASQLAEPFRLKSSAHKTAYLPPTMLLLLGFAFFQMMTYIVAQQPIPETPVSTSVPYRDHSRTTSVVTKTLSDITTQGRTLNDPLSSDATRHSENKEFLVFTAEQLVRDGSLTPLQVQLHHVGRLIASLQRYLTCSTLYTHVSGNKIVISGFATRKNADWLWQNFQTLEVVDLIENHFTIINDMDCRLANATTAH